jgi:hypothetical protein
VEAAQVAVMAAQASAAAAAAELAELAEVARVAEAVVLFCLCRQRDWSITSPEVTPMPT